MLQCKGSSRTVLSVADSPGNGPPPLPFLLWETSSEDTQGIFQGPSLYCLKLFLEVVNGSMALIGEGQILSLKKIYNWEKWEHRTWDWMMSQENSQERRKISSCCWDLQSWSSSSSFWFFVSDLVINNICLAPLISMHPPLFFFLLQLERDSGAFKQT